MEIALPSPPNTPPGADARVLLSISLRVWEPGKPGKAGIWAEMIVSPVRGHLEVCPNYEAFLGHIINAMGENVPGWVDPARQSGMLCLFSEKPCDASSEPCDVLRQQWPGTFWSKGAGTYTLFQHLTATENNGSDNLWLAKVCPVCVGSGTTLKVLTSLFHEGVCKKKDTAHNRRRAEGKKVEQSTPSFSSAHHPTSLFHLPPSTMGTSMEIACSSVCTICALVKEHPVPQKLRCSPHPPLWQQQVQAQEQLEQAQEQAQEQRATGMLVVRAEGTLAVRQQRQQRQLQLYLPNTRRRRIKGRNAVNLVS